MILVMVTCANAGDLMLKRGMTQIGNVPLTAAGLQHATASPHLASDLGQIFRVVVSGVMDVLKARQQTKDQFGLGMTTFKRADNNPLKFSPTTEDALRILFGPPTRSYLDAYTALTQSFDDLKGHQVRTYAAMQHALMAFMQDLDPETIERDSGESGIAALVGSRWIRHRLHGRNGRTAPRPPFERPAA